FGVLGLMQAPAREYFHSPLQFTPVGGAAGGAAASAEATTSPGAGGEARLAEEEILRRIEARKAARVRKEFAEADRIRKELDALGVILEDGKAGTTWKYRG
ncbi:MAG: cysteine--tRNA ligase, partial [Deltaproteobacteria bacterium]